MYDFYSLNPDQNKSSKNTQSSVTLTINDTLHNDTFYKLFETYYYDQSESNQDQLGDHLNHINYLIALLPDDANEHIEGNTITIAQMDDLNLLISTTEEREVFLPVFTDSKEFTRWYDGPAYTITVPAKWLWKFTLAQKNFNGIVFNPGSIGWNITLEHIESLLNDLQ